MSTDEGRVAMSRKSLDVLGRLLESNRKYLLSVAEGEMEDALRQKIAASDIVQDTLLEGFRDFHHFAGSTEDELRGWLRKALRHNVSNWRRRYVQCLKRSLGRELSGDAQGRSDPLLAGIPNNQRTASSIASAAEQAAVLTDLLQELPDDYQKVIRFRNWELMSFVEIGNTMNRSEDAVRMLWGRAMEELSALARKKYGE